MKKKKGLTYEQVKRASEGDCEALESWDRSFGKRPCARCRPFPAEWFGRRTRS